MATTIVDFLRWALIALGPGVVAGIIAIRLNQRYRRDLLAIGVLQAVTEIATLTNRLALRDDKGAFTALLCQAVALTVYVEHARPKDIARTREAMPHKLRELLDIALESKRNAL
jgi:hypothetical protein